MTTCARSFLEHLLGDKQVLRSGGLSATKAPSAREADRGDPPASVYEPASRARRARKAPAWLSSGDWAV